jgi:indoleamine 2,3-dioxygenase
MFPNGVIYEGVSEEPLSHRGESGANDSMIPLGDNLLQLTSHMPKNPLTEALRDFRTYRPTNHKDFLEYVQQRADEVGVRQYALKDDNSASKLLQDRTPRCH